MNRPTLETDDQPTINAVNDNGYQIPCVDIEFARKLERERDEAREKAERYRLEANAMMLQRDEAREEINRYREKLDLLPISWDV